MLAVKHKVSLQTSQHYFCQHYQIGQYQELKTEITNCNTYSQEGHKPGIDVPIEMLKQ